MDPESSTTLYEFVLSMHSIVRWAVVVFGAIALLQALIGVFAAGEPGKAGKRLGMSW